MATNGHESICGYGDCRKLATCRADIVVGLDPVLVNACDEHRMALYRRHDSAWEERTGTSWTLVDPHTTFGWAVLRIEADKTTKPVRPHRRRGREPGSSDREYHG